MVNAMNKLYLVLTIFNMNNILYKLYDIKLIWYGSYESYVQCLYHNAKLIFPGFQKVGIRLNFGYLENIFGIIQMSFV